MNLLAIDPGPERSACVLLSDDCEVRQDGMTAWPVLDAWEAPWCEMNLPAPREYNGGQGPQVVIEDFVPYGVPLDATSYRTIKVVGILEHLSGGDLVSRREVKLHLLGRARGTDAEVNAAVRSRYDPEGKFGQHAKGTKKNPGPLYGITNHKLAALAVGVTWLDRRTEG